MDRLSGRDEAVDALFRREHARLVAYARLLVDDLARSERSARPVSIEVGEDVVWAGAADGSTAVLNTATGIVGAGPPLAVGPVGPAAPIGRSAWILDADSAALVRAEPSCGCPITPQKLPAGVSSPPDAAGEVFGAEGQRHAVYRMSVKP